MFKEPLALRCPGLFITGTDTGVGKTVIACAIAHVLKRQQPGARVGVCKPLASGCRKMREGLVSEDALALAYFADCRQMLSVISPVTYAPPLAPAVAAETTGVPVDFEAVARSLHLLDESNDFLLVEGVGGLMVPIDGRDPQLTVLDLIAAIGYPVVIVTRALLGTLNHTAMTVALLSQRGCRIAGLVINGFVTDSSPSDRQTDLSMQTNRAWLQKMTGVPILATVPACPPAEVAPHKGRIPEAIMDAVATSYWPDVAKKAR